MIADLLQIVLHNDLARQLTLLNFGMKLCYGMVLIQISRMQTSVGENYGVTFLLVSSPACLLQFLFSHWSWHH